MLHIAPFAIDDKAQWLVLARAYKVFYDNEICDEEYESAWQRLIRQDVIFGLGAYTADGMVGIAHYLFHRNVWLDSVCYLQDLFVMPKARGQGIAGKLITAVVTQAREQYASRLYWMTQKHNVIARQLYDKLARHNGFIRYDFPL